MSDYYDRNGTTIDMMTWARVAPRRQEEGAR